MALLRLTANRTCGFKQLSPYLNFVFTSSHRVTVVIHIWLNLEVWVRVVPVWVFCLTLGESKHLVEVC